MRQVFLRLSGCNLACDYCDTAEAREKIDSCQVVDAAGNRKIIPNPLGIAEAAELMGELWTSGTHSVSLTGGEPLLQAEELAELLPMLRRRGMRIYLETNGTLHEELKLVLGWIDWIAMDVKLPSSQGGRDLLAAHRQFLEAAAGPNVFLKMVITPETGEAELSSACTILAEETPGLTLVLQPATGPDGAIAITPERATKLHEIAGTSFTDVHVIPQMHKLWGIK